MEHSARHAGGGASQAEMEGSAHLAVACRDRGDGAVQQHGQQAALAAAADGANDAGVALAVDQLHRQDAQHQRAQLLGHHIARQQ